MKTTGNHLAKSAIILLISIAASMSFWAIAQSDLSVSASGSSDFRGKVFTCEVAEVKLNY